GGPFFVPPHNNNSLGIFPMKALVTITGLALPCLPVADIERAADFARHEKAESTRTAYKSDFRIFQEWCSTRGVDSLPATPETVAGFIASDADAGRKASTIGRRCAAVRHAHNWPATNRRRT